MGSGSGFGFLSFAKVHFDFEDMDNHSGDISALLSGLACPGEAVDLLEECLKHGGDFTKSPFSLFAGAGVVLGDKLSNFLHLTRGEPPAQVDFLGE